MKTLVSCFLLVLLFVVMSMCMSSCSSEDVAPKAVVQEAQITYSVRIASGPLACLDGAKLVGTVDADDVLDVADDFLCDHAENTVILPAGAILEMHVYADPGALYDKIKKSTFVFTVVQNGKTTEFAAGDCGCNRTIGPKFIVK